MNRTTTIRNGDGFHMARKLLTAVILVLALSLLVTSSALAKRHRSPVVRYSGYAALAGTFSHPSAGSASAPILDTPSGSNVWRPGFQP
jgi:hypothetical protein